MASCVGLLLLTTVFFSGVYFTASSPSFTAVPAEVQPGQTANLTLTCRATPDAQMPAIYSMAIYFTPDKPTTRTTGHSNRDIVIGGVVASATTQPPLFVINPVTTPKPVVIGGVTKPLFVIGGVVAGATTPPLFVIGGVVASAKTTPTPIVIGGVVQAATTPPLFVIGGVVASASTTPTPIVIGGVVQAATTPKTVTINGAVQGATTPSPPTVAQPTVTTSPNGPNPTNPTNPTPTTNTSTPTSPLRHKLASIGPLPGIDTSPMFNGTASGGIAAGKNESVLTLTIEDPSDLDIGKYQCVVSGFDPTFTLSDVTHDAVVTRHQATLHDMGATIRRLEGDIGEMKRRWGLVDNNAVFHHSGNYTDRKYILSRSEVKGVDLCQFICNVQGGYLAEIDDEQEFQFVRNFTSSLINNDPDFPDVFLGAKYNYKQGDWQFLLHPTSRPYLPSSFYSSGYECMTMSQSSGFYMTDYECDTSNRFMCELPV